MPLQKTKAILLKAIPYLENNAILKTFTPYGMMDFMAYGIKKKQPHLLNPATLLSIVYYESRKSDMHTVKEADYLIKFNYLNKDTKGIIFSGEVARTIQIVGREAQPNKHFDQLIVHPLKKMDETKRIIWLTIPWVIIHLLELSGLLNIDMFSVEIRDMIAFFAKHQFDDIITFLSNEKDWDSRENASNLIISIANYYQDHLKNRTIATELRKCADRILLY